jgi:hypothetical protein
MLFASKKKIKFMQIWFFIQHSQMQATLQLLCKCLINVYLAIQTSCKLVVCWVMEFWHPQKRDTRLAIHTPVKFFFIDLARKGSIHMFMKPRDSMASAALHILLCDFFAFNLTQTAHRIFVMNEK